MSTLKIQFWGGQSRVGAYNCAVLDYSDRDQEPRLAIDAGGAVSKTGPTALNLPDSVSSQVWRVVLTHAHGDHIWGITEFLKESLSVLTGRWTGLVVQDFLNQNGWAALGRSVDFTEAKEPTFDLTVSPEHSGWYEWGGLPGSGVSVALFSWPHSTPESRGLVVVHIPEMGAFVWLIDLGKPSPEEEPKLVETLRQISRLGVVAVFVDSTAQGREQKTSATEAEVVQSITQAIRESVGAIYFTCFASDIGRIRGAAQAARNAGRRFALIAGRSMRHSIGPACANLDENDQPYIEGVSSYNANTGRWQVDSIEGLKVVSLMQAIKIAQEDPGSLVCFVAGSQAEGWNESETDTEIASAMTRLVLDGLRPVNSVKSLRLRPRDTVIFSASEIPDYQRMIGELKSEILYQIGPDGKLIDHSTEPVYISGHTDLSGYLRHLNPRHVIPIHCDPAKAWLMAEAAQREVPEARVLLVQDRQEIVFTADGYDGVAAAVRDIQEATLIGGLRPSERVVRVHWFGTVGVVLKVEITDDGFLRRIVGEPQIEYSLQGVDEGLKEIIDWVVRGFLARLCGSDGVLEGNVPLNRVRRELQSALFKILATQVQRETVPYPFPIMVRV